MDQGGRKNSILHNIYIYFAEQQMYSSISLITMLSCNVMFQFEKYKISACILIWYTSEKNTIFGVVRETWKTLYEEDGGSEDPL